MRGWVGEWMVGGWGVAFKKLAETLARANFFKKLRLWPDLRDFLIILRGCNVFKEFLGTLDVESGLSAARDSVLVELHHTSIQGHSG